LQVSRCRYGGSKDRGQQQNSLPSMEHLDL
jgi:hypothetical protein